MVEPGLIESQKDRLLTVPIGSSAFNEVNREIIRRRLKWLVLVLGMLTLCFARPLVALATFSFQSELYSHIVLIPFITAYLIWPKRRELLTADPAGRRCAVAPLLFGLTIIALYLFVCRSGWKPRMEDYLASMTLAWLSLLLGGVMAVLGIAALRQVIFPIAFLLFMVPFPGVVMDSIESFLQLWSAVAAHVLFKLAGMPVFRQGTSFQLPGFSMQVARECSGVHSSLVLFITSLLAGNLILRNNWSRAILALAVIPLGIVRNGLRIFVLGQLCVRISPDWINSDLHHRGGPIYFVLSLPPLFLLLLWFRKVERRKENPKI